ncbi:MAG: hypothetical protein ACLSDJ_05765 [Butyricimonas faecihominis]
MGLLKSLFASDPEIRTYVVTLQTKKPYGGSCVKKIELQLKRQEATDLGANREAGGRALAAVHWPGAPDVKITNIHVK